MSETEVSEDVKANVLSKTGQVWDELAQDDKTRALAATLVKNLSAAGDNEKVNALREGLLSTVDSRESVTDVLEKTQNYLNQVNLKSRISFITLTLALAVTLSLSIT